MKGRYSHGANAYRNVRTTTAAPYSDSLQLIQMLFSALVEALAEAEGHMSRNNFEQKAYSLNRAIKILSGLQDSLDFDKGKELALNLSDIYDYSRRSVLKAGIKNDLPLVREIRRLMTEIDSAWQLLPNALNHQPVPLAS